MNMIFFGKRLDAALYEKDVIKLRIGEWELILDGRNGPKIQSLAPLKERQGEFGDRLTGEKRRQSDHWSRDWSDTAKKNENTWATSSCKRQGIDSPKSVHRE